MEEMAEGIFAFGLKPLSGGFTSQNLTVISVISRALETVVPRGLQRGKCLHVDIVGGVDHYVMPVFETLFTDGDIAAR